MKIQKKTQDFKKALSDRGWLLSGNTFSFIQQYLCHPYSSSQKVDAVRYERFYKKMNNQSKVVDMLT